MDAGNVDQMVALVKKHDIDLIFNAVAPNFNPALLAAALKAGTDYMDTAMTLSTPHPTDPLHQCGVKLGDDEFPLDGEFAARGRLAMVGCGVEPGMADLFARYGSDHFFDEVDEIGIRDGSNLEIPGFSGISFGFSIWTTIEECTNPAIVWEAGTGWCTVPPFSEPEPFWLPEGIGMVEVAHVEHEEVICIGRAASLLKGVKKATFKYALGDQFISAMDVFKAVNIDNKEKIKVGDVWVAPRDVIAAAAPDPIEIGKRYVGQDGRRDLDQGQEGRPHPRGLPLPGGRQPGVRREVRPTGRAGADGLHASGALGTDGGGEVGRLQRAIPRAACTSRRNSRPTTTWR